WRDGGEVKVRLNTRKNQPSTVSSTQLSGSRRAPRGLSRIAASAGLKVSELKALMTVDTAMVTANWRKNAPETPPRNAQGTNTAQRTRATAITGPVTSSIALRAAWRGAT